jgi:hypothetical protein
VSNVALAAAVLLAFTVVGLAIWLLPRWQARGWRRAGITDEEKLAGLGVQARTGITQAFGGLALIATLAITAYQVNETQRSSDDNFRLAERGQVAERFSRAIDQLAARNPEGGPALDVRTGALFSLRRIGLDSKENTKQAFLVIAAYVRNNWKLPAQPKNAGSDGCGPYVLPPADIVNVLTFVLPDVAAKLLKDTPKGVLPGLRGTDLRRLGLDGLVLQRLDLTGIKFDEAALTRAHFRGSALPRSRFIRAQLDHADFGQTKLQGSLFRGACLAHANFAGAHLEKADFRGAKNLDTAVFTSAYVDGAKFTRSALDRTSMTNAQKRVVAASG